MVLWGYDLILFLCVVLWYLVDISVFLVVWRDSMMLVVVNGI